MAAGQLRSLPLWLSREKGKSYAAGYIQYAVGQAQQIGFAIYKIGIVQSRHTASSMCVGKKRVPEQILENPGYIWSGKRDLNPRRPAWEADTLPLSYSRMRTHLERETGFEPATSTLARLHSTTELLPQYTWRRHPDLNWRIETLQASALPLGHVASGAGDGI